MDQLRRLIRQETHFKNLEYLRNLLNYLISEGTKKPLEIHEDILPLVIREEIERNPENEEGIVRAFTNRLVMENKGAWKQLLRHLAQFPAGKQILPEFLMISPLARKLASA